MAGQIFASASLDELPGRTSATPTPASRDVRRSTASPSALGRKSDTLSYTSTDRPALGATPPASTLPRRRPELGFRVGIFFYLVCVALVGAATIGVFFGTGFYLLGHPTEEIIADSSTRNRGGVAPVAAKPEMPLSAAAVSAVVPGSVSVPLAGEAPARAGRVAPLSADVPAVGAASPGATTTMTALTTSAPEPAQLGATGTQPGQTAQLHAIAEMFGIPQESLPEPIQAQGGKHSELKRPEKTSTEIVYGTVTNVPDAMTWIVGNQTVRLWGIRPGPQYLLPSLVRFVDWVRAKGPIQCHRQAHSSRYQCSTATGENIAEAALLAGVGRVADGATVAYRGAEAQARRKGNGLWARP